MQTVAMNLRRIHPIRSGVEAYMHSLVTALARRDDVHLHGIVPALETPLPSTVRRVVSALPANAGSWAKLWYDLVGAGGAAARTGAALYHGVDTFLPVGLPASMRCVVNVHDLGYFRQPQLFDRKTLWLNQSHARLRLRRADHYIALSALTADDLMALMGVSSRDITVVPAAHDAFFTEPTQDVRDGVPFFMTVGGSNPRKNLDRVIEAFVAWRARGGDRRAVTLRIVGAVGANFKARESELRAEHIALEGFVTRERLRTLYRTSHGLLFPALYEGFGIPILEAMACGAPVLTTGSGATLEVAGDAAVLVDPLNVSSISDGIERLHQDGARLTVAGRRARRAVLMGRDGTHDRRGLPACRPLRRGGAPA